MFQRNERQKRSFPTLVQQFPAENCNCTFASISVCSWKGHHETCMLLTLQRWQNWQLSPALHVPVRSKRQGVLPCGQMLNISDVCFYSLSQQYGFVIFCISHRFPLMVNWKMVIAICTLESNHHPESGQRTPLPWFIGNRWVTVPWWRA